MNFKVFVVFAVFCVSIAIATSDYRTWNFTRAQKQTSKMESSFSLCMLRALAQRNVTHATRIITECAQMSKYATLFPLAYVELTRMFNSTCLGSVLDTSGLEPPEKTINPVWNQSEVCEFFDTKVLPAYCEVDEKCPDDPLLGVSLVRYYVYASVIIMSNGGPNNNQAFTRRHMVPGIGFTCPNFNLHFNPKLFEYGTKIDSGFKWLLGSLNCSKSD